MKKIIISSILAVLSFSSNAGYFDWSEEDKKLFIASNAAIALDWSTTRNMSKRYDEGFYEKSGILLKAIGGEQPKTSTVDLFFVARLAANYFITDYLNQYQPQYKKPYLYVTTITHFGAGINNINIGLKVDF